MEESAQFDDVLQLGKQLVVELGLDQSVDTLGRWMAHYVAELIHRAETAHEEDRDEKRSRCANGILELWNHHSAMPNGRRPFQNFEPILRALESLDPDNTVPRYYRPAREAASNEQKNSESATWLGIADGLDYTARLLIRFCLACAARDVVDESKKWVALADAAGATNDDFLPIIRIVSHEVELTDEKAATDEERKEIADRIKRLEAFTDLAKMLFSRLRAKLDSVDSD